MKEKKKYKKFWIMILFTIGFATGIWEISKGEVFGGAFLAFATFISALKEIKIIEGDLYGKTDTSK